VPAEGLHRPTWAEISTSAIAHNIRALKSVAGDASLCAVLKADAYGHGAITAAHAALAGGADSFAVAVIDEGMELRAAGFTSPILVLAEVAASSIPDALANDLTLTVGMHRMGVSPASLNDVIDALSASASIDLEGLFSHFAVAEGTSAEDRDFTQLQIERFDEIVSALKARGTLPRVLHLANSAGTLGYPNARHSMVRPGLSIYGYLPESWLASALEEKGEHLETALTLHTRVVAVRRVSAGDRPSYGRRRALESDSTVITLPIGYADGYPRALFAGGAKVLIKGRRYPLAGNVTMDQLVVDVGDDDVKLGDEVVLLGRDGGEFITADDWARWGNTISWEILGRVGARVPRVVVD
jgi:alanine racemase